MWNHTTYMARSKPDPDPRPTDGGSYLLDEATGKWIDQERGVMPAPITPEADDSLDA
jgi:hypothetical protein